MGFLASALTSCLFALLSVAAPIGSVAPRPPEIVESLALRAAYGVPSPQGSATVYVHSIAVHHTRTDWSTIAWRGADGVWSVSVMGQEGPGGLLRDIKKSPIPEEVRTLSAREGRSLDRLLADRALYRETPRHGAVTGVGAPYHIMEIVSPEGTLVVRWDGRLRGRGGHVADLVLGSD